MLEPLVLNPVFQKTCLFAFVRINCKNQLKDNFSHSFVVKDDGKIIGGYFIKTTQLTQLRIPEAKAYKGKQGIQGIALFLLPEYRGQGVGKRLRNMPLTVGADYIWGEHLEELNNLHEELNNLQQWLDFGRKHLTTVDGVHITVMDLR